MYVYKLYYDIISDYPVTHQIHQWLSKKAELAIQMDAQYRIGPFSERNSFLRILRILGPSLKIKTANYMVGMVNDLER